MVETLEHTGWLLVFGLLLLAILGAAVVLGLGAGHDLSRWFTPDREAESAEPETVSEILNGPDPNVRSLIQERPDGLFRMEMQRFVIRTESGGSDNVAFWRSDESVASIFATLGEARNEAHHRLGNNPVL